MALQFSRNSKKDFQDGGHLELPIKTILVYFLSTGYLDTSDEVSRQLAFWLRRKKKNKKKMKIDFQDGGHVAFAIRMILAILIYVTPTSYRFESIGLSIKER